MKDFERLPSNMCAIAASSAAMILLTVSPGQADQSKVLQCNTLAETVNQSQTFMADFEQSIQTFSSDAAQAETLDDIKVAASFYVESVEGVVTSLDSLSDELEIVQLGDPQLVEYQNRYVILISNFSNALNQAGDAMKLIEAVNTNDQLLAAIEESQAMTNEAVQAIQDLSVQESQLINEANDYCGVETP